MSGQGINSRVSRVLLDKTGWLKNSNLDFIIPDGTFDMKPFTNEEQLKMLGLDSLKKEGIYNDDEIYKEWKAGFEYLLDDYNKGNNSGFGSEDCHQWNITLNYIKNIIQRYGSFDGIIGFCEGSAVASVLLALQKIGYDYGLGNVKFFVAMSPWQSPLHKDNGLYLSVNKIDVPTLMIVGKNDMDVFLDSAQKFKTSFSNISEFFHNGEHVYPLLFEKLKKELNNIIN